MSASCPRIKLKRTLTEHRLLCATMTKRSSLWIRSGFITSYFFWNITNNGQMISAPPRPDAWAQTTRFITFVSGLDEDAVACRIIADIDGTEGSLSSSSAQDARVLSLGNRSK